MLFRRLPDLKPANQLNIPEDQYPEGGDSWLRYLVVRVGVLYCASDMREISLKSTGLECYTSEMDPRIGWTCG